MGSRKKLMSMRVVFGVLMFGVVGLAMGSPYFMIGGEQWGEALSGTLAAGTVTGLTSGEWDDYILVWESMPLMAATLFRLLISTRMD